MKNTFKIIFLLLCMSIVFFCVYKYLSVHNSFLEVTNEQKKIIDIAEIPEKPVDESKINFDKLKAINHDIVAWIYIDGTNINYPIMQTSDNLYYLNHNYNKEYTTYGSIYMDATANNDFSSLNTFIYGHYTSSGIMFGELGYYMDQEFYEKHPDILIYTPEETYTAKIFSVHVDEASSESYQMIFPTQESYFNYVNLIIEKSVIKSNVKVDITKDKIITLYSCSRETNYKRQDRYYVHAILNKN